MKKTSLGTATRGSRARIKSIARTLGAAGAVGLIAGAPAAWGQRVRSVHFSARLTVTKSAPPSCTGAVCTIVNSGHGVARPFGRVTFTTHITADGSGSPCGPHSQWLRITRTIHTRRGTLNLSEGGLQCPIGGTPHVRAVWAIDRAHSTGAFATAHGAGTDQAFPMRAATPTGTITFAR